ncbi:MAG TPA: Abi-alpha family protein [Terracidiphilus sp.]|nr:Abi-alpha family protein [Terracidiphilus sp.]
MCDPDELGAKAVGEAVEKILESEPVNNLLAPITEELGLALGEVASVFRFYTTENMAKIFKKWARQRKKKTIKAEEFKRVLPLLQAASLQSDEDLQERWAALLESTVSDSGNVLPSFGNTLSQLTGEEARYLEELWTAVNSNEPMPDAPYRRTKSEFDHRFMIYVFDPKLSDEVSEFRLKRHRMKRGSDERATPTERDAVARFSKVTLFIHDLERLGIIGTKTRVVSGRSNWVETEEKEVEIPGEPFLHERTIFTPYGRKFINAVTPRKLHSGR